MAKLEACRVLVVEDEYYLATDVSRGLEAEGAQVLGPFPDQDSALAAVEQDRPDCAILDVNFGRGANFDLADRLQQMGVPFLFFTGYDRHAIPARFSEVQRLEKPVDASRLLRAAAALCGVARHTSIN